MNSNPILSQIEECPLRTTLAIALNNIYKHMKKVLVFKTSVATKRDVRFIRPFIDELVNKSGRWNFDLEDCDNILRIESSFIATYNISKILNHHGYECEVLK